MIHARHQYQPMRDFYYGELDRVGRKIWTPKPAKHAPNGGNHTYPMPPSLRARKPWLFDGRWLTAVQKRRDTMRAHRRALRTSASIGKRTEMPKHEPDIDF